MSRTADRLTARCLGVALVAAACDPPALAHAPLIDRFLAGAAVAAALWAAPMVDERPVSTAMRWTAVARRRRTTLLAAGAVAIAAVTGPPLWPAACVTVLLLAYLLVTDPWTSGVTAPRGARAPAPALAAAGACAVVFLAAQAPVADTSWSRIPAALALAAAATALALALSRRRGPH